MSQKHLITTIALLFAMSTAFLFWQNTRELDPDQGKSWWTLAFDVLEKPENLSFVVENHSDQTDFQYEVTVNRTSLIKGSFALQRGEKAIITPPLTAKTNDRTKITVTLGKEKKEIYR